MRVVVLGAGYAGLTVARRLERQLPNDVELLVVDVDDHHLVQHELHRVIRRPDVADALRVPLETALERATVRRARVTDLDVDAREVTVQDVANGGETGGDGDEDLGNQVEGNEADGDEVDGDGVETIPYDFAAVCLGAETDFYDLPGVEEHGLPLKRLEHAHAIREAVLAAPGGDVVIGGAGLSGVQVAGEIAALSAERDLDLDVTLLEMSDRITPRFHEQFAAAVRRELADRGVTVLPGRAVAEADRGAVHTGDGESFPFDVFVWTGGLRGPAALDGERPAVAADLRLADRTYVVGDAGRITDADGEPVPASAQTAVREAKVAAAAIADGVGRVRRATPASAATGSTADPDAADERAVDASTAADPDRPIEEAGGVTSTGTADGGVEAAFDETAVDGSAGPGPAAAADGDDVPTYHFDVPGWIVSVGDTAVGQLGPLVVTGEPARIAKAAVGAGHLGSVGEVERASRLVHDELGWPAGRAVDLPGALLARTSLTDAVDPATPSEYEYPLALLDDVVAGALPGDEPLDITRFTRLADRRSPGSPVDVAASTASGTIGSVLHLAGGGDDGGPDSGNDEVVTDDDSLDDDSLDDVPDDDVVVDGEESESDDG